MALCGANLNFDAITESAGDLKTALKSKLGGAGTFTSASDLTSLVDGKVSALTSKVSGLIPELPTVPPLSLQSELTALAGFDLTNPAGILDYQSKLSSITDKFGGALSTSGFSLDTIVSQVAPATGGLGGGVSGALSQLTDAASGASSLATDAISVATELSAGIGGVSLPSLPTKGDVCELCPNFEIPDGATDALQTAQNSVLAQTEGAFEELSSFTENEDFKAAFTKAQEKLSSAETQQDITSGLAQAEKDLSSVTGGLLDKVPSDLSVKIPELPNIKGLGSKIPKKLPFDV